MYFMILAGYIAALFDSVEKDGKISHYFNKKAAYFKTFHNHEKVTYKYHVILCLTTENSLLTADLEVKLIRATVISFPLSGK